MIALKLGGILFQVDLSSETMTCHCFAILAFGYVLDHIFEYSEEVVYICDKILELVVQSEEISIIKWWFLTMIRSISKEKRFTTYFTSNSKLIPKLQNLIYNFTENSISSIALKFILSCSTQTQFNIDSNLYNSLSSLHQNDLRHNIDVIRILINLIRNVGAKGLLTQNNDISNFVFSSVQIIKSKKLIAELYNCDALAIDIVCFNTSLELLDTFWQDQSSKIEDLITTDMISKLEKPIGCFSDCYQQWKSDHYNRKYDNLMKDSTIDQSAKHLCETIKKISDKLNKVTKSFRYEGNSELDTVSNKIYDYITCLESGIYNYESNFQEEHKFRNDQIEINIYDKEIKK